MAAPAPEPTSTIGPYRVVRRLGIGGMGVVYLGHDQTTGAAAAIKLIRPEHAANPEYRARLRRELAIAQQIPRFCTASVLAADLDADPPWVATEYIDGPDLDLVLLQRGRLTGTELETLAVGVAVALRAFHQYDIVHRDLKPSNILLSRLGPRVIDFGIARFDDHTARTRLTQTGVAIGTPSYMAPEQLTSRPLTTAVDVFAWAGLVVRAGTGRPAFGRGYAAMDAILHQQPDLGDLAEPLRGLVTEAFHKDPARRPSAAELADRLSRAARAATSQVIDTAAAPPAATSPASPIVSGTPAPPMAAPAETRSRTADRRPGWRPALAAACAVVAVVTAVTTTAWLTRSGPGDGIGDGGAGAASAGKVGEATGPQPFGTELLTLTADGIDSFGSVAVAELDGVPVAVAGGYREIAVWDLASGELIGAPFAQPNMTNFAHLGDLDGAPIAVVADFDYSISVWDLGTHRMISGPLAGHTDSIRSLATGELAGTPVVASGGADGTIRFWDPATGQPVGDPLTGLTVTPWSLFVGDLDGTPTVVAQTGSLGGGMRAWEATTGEPIGIDCCADGSLLAVGDLDGAPIIITDDLDLTTGGWVLVVWDLRTGEPIHELAGHFDYIHSVATGELDGTPIVVSGGTDRTVRVWDLTAGQQIGAELIGHSERVRAVALGQRDGAPVAVTAGEDGTVRVWSLAPPDPTD